MQHKGRRFVQWENILQGLKRADIVHWATAYISHDDFTGMLVSEALRNNYFHNEMKVG
jgi:hypothetical protein